MLVAFELYLRKTYPFLNVKFTGQVVPHYLYNHTLRPYHEEQYEIQGFYVDRKFNSLGLDHREEIQIPKPDSIYRVLFVGDSFVEGLDSINSIPAVVQSSIPAKTSSGKQFEIINCGQSSYSPLLHIARFKHQLYILQADAIVLLPDLTDVYDDWVRYKNYAVYDKDNNLVRVLPSSYGVYFNETLDRFGYYRINLFMYRAFLLKVVLKLVNQKRVEEHSEGIFDHALEPEENLSPKYKEMINFSIHNIEDYSNLLRSQGIHLSIVVYPHLPQIEGTYNRAYEKAIQNLCIKQGIFFKSFFDEISNEVKTGAKIYFENDMHFNTIGYRKLGKHIANWINAFPQESIGISAWEE